MHTITNTNANATTNTNTESKTETILYYTILYYIMIECTTVYYILCHIL